MNGQRLYPQGGFLGGPATPILPVLSKAQGASLGDQVVKNTYDYVLYDTKYFKAGTALSGTPITFFATQQGQLDQLINDTTVQFTKQKFMTNLLMPSQLERGQTFRVTSVQAFCSVPGNFDLTVQASGNTILPLTLPTEAVTTAATAGVIATNLEMALLTMGYLSLKIGSGTYEEGPLLHFPSQFGISGYAGAAFTGTAQAGIIVPNEAIANNGFGRARELSQSRTIVNGQRFGVNVEFPIGFTPSRNGQIQICLAGVLERDVA